MADDREHGWPERVAESFPGIIAAGVMAIAGLVWSMSKDLTVAVSELKACVQAVAKVSERMDKVEARQGEQEADLTELRTILNMTKHK